MLKLIVVLGLCLTVYGLPRINPVSGWLNGKPSMVSDLAVWAIQQLSTLAGFEGEYTIRGARDVTIQFYDGISYKFTLDVIHRDPAQDNKYIFKSCDLYIFDQSWTNTRNFVEAPVCQAGPQYRSQIAGGWEQVTAITDDILTAARQSAKELTAQLGFEGDHTVLTVRNAQKQLVNGVNYKLTVDYLVASADNKYTFKTCDLAFNFQAWTNKVTFLQTPSCQASQVRNLVAGGWQQVTAITDDIQTAARQSAKELTAQLGFEGEHNVMVIRKAQKQIVNGVNYKMTVDYLVASADNQYTFKTCDLAFNFQAWTNKVTFLETPSCQQSAQSRAGGWQQVTAITDDILTAARQSAKELTTQLGFEGEHNVMVVRNAEKQVVNGINYKFTVDYLVASADNKYTFKTCDLKFNFQAWTNKVTFLETPVCKENPQLRDNNNNNDENLSGAWENGNVAEVAEIARWATRYLSTFTGIQGEHTVMTPKNVKKQVVNGVNYKFTLDVLINRAEDNKYFTQSCDLYVYEQSWTNTRKFVEDPKCVNNPL